MRGDRSPGRSARDAQPHHHHRLARERCPGAGRKLQHGRSHEAGQPTGAAGRSDGDLFGRQSELRSDPGDADADTNLQDTLSTAWHQQAWPLRRAPQGNRRPPLLPRVVSSHPILEQRRAQQSRGGIPRDRADTSGKGPLTLPSLTRRGPPSPRKSGARVNGRRRERSKLNPRTGCGPGWCRRARGWWRGARPAPRSVPRCGGYI